MEQSKRNTRQRQGGFTLIELMIVVAVIGVLAAIAIPRYQDYVAKSEFSAGLATLRGIQTNADLYMAENGNDLEAISYSDLGISEDTITNGTLTYITGGYGQGGVVFSFVNESPLKGTLISYMTKEDGGWVCLTNSGQDWVPNNCEEDDTVAAGTKIVTASNSNSEE